MARMGHDSERAAMIYQHQARGADTAITNAIDAHIDAEQSTDQNGGDGPAGVLVPAANGTLMAHRGSKGLRTPVGRGRPRALTWGFWLERAKGIEPS